MSATPPDGAAALCPAQPVSTPSARKRPVTIPWREVACRLAEGARPGAIAADLGLQEERIWRHLRKSLRFRFYLQQAVDRQRLLAGLQLAATAPGALVSRSQQAEDLDGAGLRLLAEAGGGSVPPEGGTQKQIEQLGETASLPPNMAWRARMAAERRGMDLQAAEARGFLDGLNSGLARAVAVPVRPDSASTRPESAPNRPDSASTGPESAPNRPDSTPTGPESAPNRPDSTPTGPESAPNRPDSTPTGPESASNRPDSTSAAPRPRPPQVALRPPAEPPSRAIVDLEGPDLARLRAQGLLGGGQPPDS